MKRSIPALLVILAAISSAWPQSTTEYILAAHRTGVAEIIDSGTLQTIARLHFDFKVETLSANADPSKLDVAGYGENEGCCKEYTLDLGAMQLTRLITPNTGGFGRPIVSLDGRWSVELKSFPEVELKMADRKTGTAQHLFPAHLPRTEENCGGNWAAQGVWSGEQFYLYVACPDHPGLLTSISPDGMDLTNMTEVDAFNEAPGCRWRLPVGKTLLAAGGHLLLYEPTGGKSARSCPGELPGGVWNLNAETGKLSNRIAPEWHFNTLQADRSGTIVYGLAPGNPEWGDAVQLVRLKASDGQVLGSRRLDRGVWRIAAGQLGTIQAGDVHVMGGDPAPPIQ